MCSWDVEERSRGVIEIERKECLMRHQWSLRWPLYPKTTGLSGFQVGRTVNRQGDDASETIGYPLRRRESRNPVPRLCVRLQVSESALVVGLCLWLPDKEY